MPLIADTSLWFVKRRGIAVAVCASGNYLAGALWPPIVQYGIETIGWRNTYTGMGLVCGVGMALLALRMRQRPPMVQTAPAAAAGVATVTADRSRPFGVSPGRAQLLLFIAGIACCVAMSMRQVHIVAYCTDLGFGAARGAEMLSLMLASGIFSRLVSGMICDRIGGVRTLLLGSALSFWSVSARADLWAYVDAQGHTHFAAEQVDERYKLFFKGADFERLQRITPDARRVIQTAAAARPSAAAARPAGSPSR